MTEKRGDTHPFAYTVAVQPYHKKLVQFLSLLILLLDKGLK